MITKHQIIIGDSREMDRVKDASVHLVVTSPPYWQLKDYGSENQIGFHDTYESYINNLNLVWQECYRILHPGCRLVINIGDQFARSVYYGRYKIIPIRTEIIKFCETIGFDYMGAIIWQKKTTMNTTGGATVMGSFPFPRNGIIEIDYEFILIFKKPGVAPKVSEEIKQKSIIPKEKWKEYFSGHWYFNGERQDNHIAMFPVELPKRIIEMFTFMDDTVLDPFLGSGTTSLAAMILNRNSIGYEINKNFLPIIKNKIQGNKNSLFHQIEYVIDDRKHDAKKWEEKIKNLKYIFVDPIKFDKKVDPNKLKFGSKISIDDVDNKNLRQRYFTVREILGPTTIKLSNDVIVRLIGIKPIEEHRVRAVKFLKKKILKSQIYLKYDSIKYDQENNLLAYVFMKNKTFINAHLIKNNLCKVDNEQHFSLKDRFNEIERITIHFDDIIT